MQTKQTATTARGRAGTLRQKAYQIGVHSLPMQFLLVALWTMLWHEISWISVTSGILVAYAVTKIFYLPPFELTGRFNPLAALHYLFYFLFNLVLGSLQVTWFAVWPGKHPKPAVLAVPLRTNNDFILTMTGLTVSLIPGSLVVDTDRYGSVLYLHTIHAPDAAAREKVRAEALLIEQLLVRAIGSKAEEEACSGNH